MDLTIWCQLSVADFFGFIGFKALCWLILQFSLLSSSEAVCVAGYQRYSPTQLFLKAGNHHPASRGPQETADLRQACWSGQRHPAFMGSPGIKTGISNGLVIMSDAAVCGDYEEFEDWAVRSDGRGATAGRRWYWKRWIMKSRCRQMRSLLENMKHQEV